MLVYNFSIKFVTAAFEEAADKLNFFIGLIKRLSSLSAKDPSGLMATVQITTRIPANDHDDLFFYVSSIITPFAILHFVYSKMNFSATSRVTICRCCLSVLP